MLGRWQRAPPAGLAPLESELDHGPHDDWDSWALSLPLFHRPSRRPAASASCKQSLLGEYNGLRTRYQVALKRRVQQGSYLTVYHHFLEQQQEGSKGGKGAVITSQVRCVPVPHRLRRACLPLCAHLPSCKRSSYPPCARIQ